jgi:hypothetical protein
MIIRKIYYYSCEKNIILVIKLRIHKVGAAYGTYGGKDMYMVLMGNLTERDHFEDLDGKVTPKRIFKIWDGYMDWIAVAQERGRLRALVHAIITPQFPYSTKTYLTS